MKIQEINRRGRAMLIFVKSLKEMSPVDRRLTMKWLNELVDMMDRQDAASPMSGGIEPSKAAGHE